MFSNSRYRMGLSKVHPKKWIFSRYNFLHIPKISNIYFVFFYMQYIFFFISPLFVIKPLIILETLSELYLNFAASYNSSMDIYMRCKFYALQFFRTENKSNSQFSDFEK